MYKNLVLAAIVAAVILFIFGIAWIAIGIQQLSVDYQYGGIVLMVCSAMLFYVIFHD